jgi:hypothetical protein
MPVDPRILGVEELDRHRTVLTDATRSPGSIGWSPSPPEYLLGDKVYF